MIITRAPLRVSFIGGGTDTPAWYERHGQGQVLAAAISLYVTVIVARHHHPRRYRISYSTVETSDSVEHIRHDLIRQALLKSGEVWGGVEIHTIADVPGRGSGLGSSAAVLVGTLQGLAAMRGRALSADNLAGEAAAVEINDLRNGAGKQDHWISTLGGVVQLTFANKEPAVTDERLAIPADRLAIWSRWMALYPTGVGREARPLMEETQKVIEAGGADEAMRDTLDMIPALRAALFDARMEAVGSLLDQAWDLKRRATPHVSSPLLDNEYHRARLAGAIGGKLCGAGGGGYWLLVVPPGKRQDVGHALFAKPIEVTFGVPGSRVVFREE